MHVSATSNKTLTLETFIPTMQIINQILSVSQWEILLPPQLFRPHIWTFSGTERNNHIRRVRLRGSRINWDKLFNNTKSHLTNSFSDNVAEFRHQWYDTWHTVHYFGLLNFTLLPIMTLCNVIIILNIIIMTTIINDLLAPVFLLMKVNDIDLFLCVCASPTRKWVSALCTSQPSLTVLV